MGFENKISNKTSKAFLRHLFVSDEILGLQIASLHNLSFYFHLLREARRQILQGSFLKWMSPLVDEKSPMYLHRRL